MPHDTNPEWEHVYDWLDAPPKDEAERQAKIWLEQFVKPASEKDRKWLDAHVLRCAFGGKMYRVTGASRLGDVWLHSDLGRSTGYEHRVNVLECSDWTLTPLSPE